jgi:hypothetical protein
MGSNSNSDSDAAPRGLAVVVGANKGIGLGVRLCC